MELVQFANQEYKPRIPETVRLEDMYLFHSLYYPDPNTSYMQMFLTAGALSLADVNRITLVLPFIPYLRQDRKDEPRVPISAATLAKLTGSINGVKRIITMDMHNEAEQGFYDLSVDNLPGWIVYENYFRNEFNGDMSDVVVTAPDIGGVKRAAKFAEMLSLNSDADVPTYCMDKRRGGPNEVAGLHFIGGDITGKRVILYDDMIDTGTSISKAAMKLMSLGARQVYICATHGIFSTHNGARAEDVLRTTGLEVLVTESIPRSAEYRASNSDWLKMLPLDDLIAETVLQTSTVGGSVSGLFKGRSKTKGILVTP